MENPAVLMLAWGTSSFSASKNLYPTPFAIAKALAQQCNLTLILPQVARAIELGNATIYGLDTLDVQATKPQIHPPEFFPFSKEAYTQKHIPLYGAPVLSEPEKSRQHFPGESITVGNFSQENDLTNSSTQSIPFNYYEFTSRPIQDQLISYARCVTRAAYALNFDYIYAYDWMTYLAATELQVWSGKKLAAHVSSLSVENSSPDSKGWKYEIKKRIFEKADILTVDNKQIAQTLHIEYSIPYHKIYPLTEAIFLLEQNVNNIKRDKKAIEIRGIRNYKQVDKFKNRKSFNLKKKEFKLNPYFKIQVFDSLHAHI